MVRGWGPKPNAPRGPKLNARCKASLKSPKPNAKLPKRGKRGIFGRVEAGAAFRKLWAPGLGLPRSLFCFGVHVIVIASCNVQGCVVFLLQA